MWRGGISHHADGYIYRYAPDHPSVRDGYVFEHRLVMERWLRENDPNSPYLIRLGENLYLSPRFVVHHKDGDKTNNRIENLQCMTNPEHLRHHAALRAANPQ